MFPIFNCKVSYLGEFLKPVNEKEEKVFKRWIKSNLVNNYDDIHNIHQLRLQRVDDEQLEGSLVQFQFQALSEIQFYKIHDLKDSSDVELQQKKQYVNNIYTVSQ